MIITHQHFALLEKRIIERIIFMPPIKKSNVMDNEACFLYSVNGQSSLYGAYQKIDLVSKDDVVLKCGSYLQNYHKTLDEKPYEKIVIHFNPEILKLIYRDELPTFLKNKTNTKPQSIHLIRLDDW